PGDVECGRPVLGLAHVVAPEAEQHAEAGADVGHVVHDEDAERLTGRLQAVHEAVRVRGPTGRTSCRLDAALSQRGAFRTAPDGNGWVRQRTVRPGHTSPRRSRVPAFRARHTDPSRGRTVL